MRDVTDNVTGELPGVEQKRGRGRPRKAHALTNAERQAAFRARRKKEQGGSDRSVTVTKKPADVDAYDECRLEVEELRERVDELLFELREATAQHNEMVEQLASARRTIDSYKHELLKAYGKFGGDEVVAKSVTRKRVTKKPADQKVVTKVCTLEEWPFPVDPKRP